MPSVYSLIQNSWTILDLSHVQKEAPLDGLREQITHPSVGVVTTLGKGSVKNGCNLWHHKRLISIILIFDWCSVLGPES